jgi:hypothetical protein
MNGTKKALLACSLACVICGAAAAAISAWQGALRGVGPGSAAPAGDSPSLAAGATAAVDRAATAALAWFVCGVMLCLGGVGGLVWLCLSALRQSRQAALSTAAGFSATSRRPPRYRSRAA